MPDFARVTYTDKSGTVTAGGTAQTLMGARASRQGFVVQNLSATDLYINATGTAAANSGSIRIAAGNLYECPNHAVPITAVSIFGATTAQAFTAYEY